MTFEQWVSEWLAGKLSHAVATVITSQQVAVRLEDVTDLNKHQRASALTITVRFPKKLDAATVSFAVQNAIVELPRENFIHSAYVDTEFAERVGAPAQWEYTTSIRVLHRRRLSWQA